jgi:4-aminobutyrate aminotransferase/(S)-3-amino-2-methylpropionate transaminase
MGVVRITGEIPGPKSRALAARLSEAVTSAVSTVHPIFIASGSSATLTDVDGNTFIDFTAGISVINVGHAQPEVVAAIADAARAFTHTAFQVCGYEAYVEVCETLCRIAPIDGERRAVLFSTGAEAVENAVKIARAATGRGGVLCFAHAFHGRTLLGLSLTGKAAPYKAGFGPYAPEMYRLPYPYSYRGQGIAPGGLETALLTLVRPHDLAAVIIEPVLGEGGFITPPRSFWPELQEFCGRHGVLLIADEVQTGFGRTGPMFASGALDIRPDLMTMAKSIAGGLPLSAVVGRAAVMNAVPKGGLGGTFAGNPLACRAALATIRILEELARSGRSVEVGQRVRSALDALALRHEVIGEVRGLGAMLAIELVKDRATKEPAADETQHAIDGARRRGLLLLPAGTYGNVLRLLMPLTISDTVLDEGLGILTQVFDDLTI